MILSILQTILGNSIAKHTTVGIYKRLGKGLVSNYPKTLLHLKRETKDALKVMRADAMYKRNISAYMPLYGTFTRSVQTYKELKFGGVLRERFIDYRKTYKDFSNSKKELNEIFNTINSKKGTKDILERYQSIYRTKGQINLKYIERISSVKGYSHGKLNAHVNYVDAINEKIKKFDEFQHRTRLSQAKLITRTSRFGRDIALPGVTSLYLTKKLMGGHNKEE